VKSELRVKKEEVKRQEWGGRRLRLRLRLGWRLRKK
jgi:hypothetical protein